MSGALKEKEIKSTLALRAWQSGYRHEAVERETALDVLLAGERGELADAAVLSREERLAVRLETLRALLAFCFQRGPDPLAALKNIFTVVRKVRPELLGGLTMAEEARMFDQTRAAVSHRGKELGRFLQQRGTKGYLSRGEKSESASKKYRALRTGKKRPPLELLSVT